MLKPTDFPRDYWPMLRVAQELQFYDGYLGIDGQKQKGELMGQLKSARTAFVDDMINDSRAWWNIRHLTNVDKIDGISVGKSDALCVLIATDLDELAERNTGYVSAIDYIREPLFALVRRNADKGAFRRKVERYSPPVLGAVAFAATAIYLYKVRG